MDRIEIEGLDIAQKEKVNSMGIPLTTAQWKYIDSKMKEARAVKPLDESMVRKEIKKSKLYDYACSDINSGCDAEHSVLSAKFNEVVDSLAEAICAHFSGPRIDMKKVKSILCKACGDCTDLPEDCEMLGNQVEALGDFSGPRLDEQKLKVFLSELHLSWLKGDSNFTNVRDYYCNSIVANQHNLRDEGLEEFNKY